MSKNIVIVGGGITGLSLLHYLRIKNYFNKDIKIVLFEKNDAAGGTVATQRHESTVFEFGPNGFLNQSDKTFELLEDLGLKDELIAADNDAKRRYISQDDELYLLPMSPKALIKFPLLSFVAKVRILLEVLIPKGNKKQESIYQFMARRLGRRFADLFAHCIVSGIYAGDAKKISLKHAFPKMYALEEEYGSIIRGAIKRKKKKIKLSGKELFSLKRGMQSVTDALAEKYKSFIHTDHEVKAVSSDGQKFILYTKAKQYVADEVYLCAPAYVSAQMLKGLNGRLSQCLAQVSYAPVAVVGLLYNKKDFAELPAGFGYLNSAKEKSQVLGVLFESQIFEGRCGAEQVLVRAMVGGVLNASIVELSEKEIVDMVKCEVKITLKPIGSPTKTFIKLWPNAIPQYDLDHEEFLKQVDDSLEGVKGLHLSGNYLRGVSFNECIKNAYELAEKST